MIKGPRSLLFYNHLVLTYVFGTPKNASMVCFSVVYKLVNIDENLKKKLLHMLKFNIFSISKTITGGFVNIMDGNTIHIGERF